MGHKVAVRVSPVIRKDDSTSIMALELTRASDDASVDDINATAFSDNDNKLNLSSYLGTPSIYRPGAGASGVKLLDLGSGRVWSATDGGGGFMDLTPGEKVTSYLSFGKVDTVTVYVPMAGFTTVSILEAEATKKANINLDTAQTELDKYPNPATELAEPVAIERYTRALDDSTSTKAGGKDVTVTLASDVTFASDSADLTPASDTQLQTVSGQLAQYPDGGTLTIVGHTDDIQDDAYNQALSERRANAVKTRLEQITRLDKWQTSVTGKGESEPKIKETTDEARAANRRVEITLTPTGGTTPRNNATASPGSGGKVPDPQGPVAKGPEGVTLTSKGTDTSGEVTIALDHVTRTGGYLLGTLTCTVKAGSTGAPLQTLLRDPQTVLANQRDEEGSALPTFYATDGLTLIAGGERIFPADYQEADLEAHIPLTELRVSDHLKGGITTICVTWPDPGGDTITLDHPEGKYSPKGTAYRLTDIPVKNS
ncbi:OmpA family protein [Actinomyces sp. ZJ308]|uniref:OmpA family protein n=1 Tax=Actinomyces sp. ZJ308 TaxID=2708342 RepID=UPI001FB93C00|nr:OmpA family protein [Actinomyces sp. ZJ308]